MKRTFSLVVFAIALLAVSTASFAQSTPSEPLPNLFGNSKISQKTLPNGVRGVAQENPGTDLVSVQVWVKAGSRYEGTGNNGVTSLIESLSLSASKSYPEATQDGALSGPQEAIEALGGVVSSLTARDSMFFSATVASPFLPNTLRALADATLFPDLADKKVEDAKEDALRGLILQTDPIRQAADLAYATAFPEHPYRFSPVGSAVGIAALTGAKVRAFHAQHFSGSNISVIVSGDLSADAAHKLIAQYFGSSPIAPKAAIIPEAKIFKSVRSDTRRTPLPVTAVDLAFRSPSVKSHTDAVAADILLSYWKETRFAALRDVLNGASPLGGSAVAPPDSLTKDGDKDKNDDDGTPDEQQPDEAALPLALGYDVDFLTQHDDGLFIFTLIAPRNRNAAIAAVLRELARVTDEGLAPDDLARAKRALKLQYMQQGESVNGQAGALGFYDAIDSYQFAADYQNVIDQVTNDDIRKMAKRYFAPETRVVATIEGTRPQPQAPDSGAIIAQLFE